MVRVTILFIEMTGRLMNSKLLIFIEMRTDRSRSFMKANVHAKKI